MSKLGIVSDEQLDKELADVKANKDLPYVHPLIEELKRGRGKGNVEVPENLRKLIGETSNIEGRSAALELAKDFGISPSSVSAYTAGATSTATIDKPDTTLINYINARKTRISKKALGKLTLTLDQITPDKLSSVSARNLAGIAKDMSVVAKNMEPANQNESGANTPKFVVYAPTIRDERTYETVVVSDNY